MRIILFAPTFYPELGASATRNYFFYKYLKEFIDISILAPKKRGIEKGREFIIYLWKQLPFFPFYLYKTYRAVKRKKPNLLFISHPPVIMGFSVYLVSRLLHIPFIVDARDTVWELHYEYKGFLKLFLKLQIILEKLILKDATKILTVTEGLRQEFLKRYNLPLNKIYLVPNGTDLSSIKFSKTKTFDIVYCGTLHSYRDPERLFETLSLVKEEIPDVKILFLSGSLKRYSFLKVSYLLKIKGLLKNVAFYPMVSPEKLSFWLSKAKIAISPFIKDPIFNFAVGSKTYEYLGAGLPTVALASKLNKELSKLLIDNNAGFIEETPKEAAGRIVMLLKNKNLLKRLSKNALITAKKYDRKEIVNRLYQDVIHHLKV